MTDGILLTETRSDPLLMQYDTIILDEAHERSLNIDLCLGIIKLTLQRRKDLTLIITSATLDTEKFSAHFGNAPVIQVSGRTYPVETRYWPPEDFDDTGSGGKPVGKKRKKSSLSREQLLPEYAAKAYERLTKTENGIYGDMLVFMPTEQDIRETADLFSGKKENILSGSTGDITVLPLYARMPASKQREIFKPSKKRKIIIGHRLLVMGLFHYYIANFAYTGHDLLSSL